MASRSTSIVYRNFTKAVLARAQRSIVRATVNYLTEFTRQVEKNANDPKDRIDAHRRMAETARKASAQAYRARRAQSDVGQYRMGQGRISGGRLQRVIESPDFTSYDADGFGVGNRQRLNSEAKHWARINYSAGPQAKPFDPIEFRFDGEVVSRYQSRRAPRPLWNIPSGSYFTNGELRFVGAGRGMSARPIKAAHQPYHFIEEGVQAAAKTFDREYTAMVTKWINDSARRANGS